MNNRTIYTYLRVILLVWVNNIKHLCPRIILAMLMSMMGIQAFAHDIAVRNADGVTIYYLWINNRTELAVSYGGSSSTQYSNEYSGNVTIPESVVYQGKTYSVTSIRYEAFRDCSGLTSITIPNSVTSIGTSAFWLCTSLTSVTIPTSVTTIGSSAFSGCSGLKSITIPTSVTTIGSSAFSGCSGLKSITIPNSVTSIGNYGFYNCSGLTSITIGNSVTSIGGSAFDGCSGLTSVNISDLEAWCNISFSSNYANPLVFAHHLFLNRKEVTKLTIPNSVTSIGNYGFTGCRGLTTVTIPNSVTTIGSSAFSGCIGLISVTIPNSVTTIRDEAFLNCNGLEKVHLLREQPFALGSYAFSNISYSSATLYVPVGSKAKYQATNGWKNFKNIVEEDMTSYNVTLTAKNYTREYGEENPTFGYEVNSGSIASGQPTFSCSATKTSPVGTYDIVIQKGTVSNGTVNLVKGTLTITKAPLTISAGTYSRKEGEDNPDFTLTYSGFKNGETKNVLTKQPTVSCSATKNSPVGSYTVSVSGAEAQNYEITYQNGTLTVTEDNANSTSSNMVNLVNNGDMEGNDVSSFFYRVQGGDIMPAVITNGVGVNGSRGIVVAAPAREKEDYDNQFFFRLNKPVYPDTKIRVSFDYRADKQAMVRSEAHSEPSDYINWTEFRVDDFFTRTWQHFSYEGTLSSYNSSKEKPLRSIAFSLSLLEEANNYYFDNIKFEVETDNTENPEGDIITFADANVKAICVQHWDKNGDGELSKEEAAAVTDLGEVFYNNSKIGTFDELQYFTGLKSIGDRAFYGCIGLTSVTIPNSVTSIGSDAFYDCDNLTSITIPNSVTTL